MSVINQSHELRSEKVSTLLRRYSIPSIISMIVVALYNIVDRVYIGQSMGPMAISGLTLTLPVTTMVTAIGTLVGVGASSRISIVLGMNDIKWARNILAHVPMLTIIFSILFVVPTMLFMDELLVLFGGSEHTIPYAKDYLMIVVPASLFTNLCFAFSNLMRSTGFPKKSMYAISVGVVLNIILDPIFIFGFDMGIRGVAIATAISMFIGAIYASSHFFNKKHEVSFKRESFVIKRNIVKNIVSIGFSPFMLNFIGGSIAIIVNNQLKKYGGDIAIGSFGIINSYQVLLSLIVMGICMGMQPIIGYNYGSNNTKRVKDVFFLAVKLSTLVYLVGFLFLEFFPEYATIIFTNDKELIDYTITGMRITFLTSVTIGVQIVISNYFMSVGRGIKSTMMTVTRQVVFLVPCLFILPIFFGVNGVWMSIPVSDFLAFVVATYFIIMERKRLYKNTKNISLKAYIIKK